MPKKNYNLGVSHELRFLKISSYFKLEIRFNGLNESIPTEKVDIAGNKTNTNEKFCHNKLRFVIENDLPMENRLQ